jgi:hypothetical protein
MTPPAHALWNELLRAVDTTHVGLEEQQDRRNAANRLAMSLWPIAQAVRLALPAAAAGSQCEEWQKRTVQGLVLQLVGSRSS